MHNIKKKEKYMNHKIIFSGKEINLNSSDMIQQLEDALACFYPKEIVKLNSYKEIDNKTIEIEVGRNYKGAASDGLNQCVNHYDMSIITGLDMSAFEPWGNPLVGSLIPWSDEMVYCPDQVFGDLYKQQNEVMVQEKIKRVSFLPTTNNIKIRVEYVR